MANGEPIDPVLVKRVTIERFRGIRAADVCGLGQINAIVGRNNAGKTTLLEALLLAAHRAAGTAGDVLGRTRQNLLLSLRNEPAGSIPISWWHGRTARSGPIVIQAELVGCRFSVNVKTGDGGFSAIDHRAEPAEHLAVARLGAATLFDPAGARGMQFESMGIWDRILDRRGDRRLTAWVNQLFRMSADGLSWSPEGLRVLMHEIGVRVDDLGDGTRLALRLLMLCLLIEDTALVIDELESHQHPGSLQELCRVLAGVARERNLQLFVTTHSRECVCWLMAAAVEIGVPGATIHCRLDDGQLTVRAIPASSVLGLDASDTDVRFLDLHG